MIKLLYKEFQDDRNWIIGLFSFGIGVNIILLLTKARPIIMVPVSLSFTFQPVFLYAFLKPFFMFKDEWNRNTIYTLLSLPVKGYEIILSKVVVIMAELFVYLFVIMVIPYLFTLAKMGTIYGVTFAELMKIWIYTSFVTIMVIPFSTFSYITGRLSPKLKGLTTFFVFIGTGIVFRLVLPFLNGIFRTVPKLRISIEMIGNYESHTIPMAWFYSTLLFGAILLWASSKIIEKVEV